MSWLAASFVVAFVSWLVWAFTASYLSTTLRDCWPELYAKLGSPKPTEFWSRRVGVTLDEFTLTRRFRTMGIENSDILLQLELTCWSRWFTIVGTAIFVLLLLLSFWEPRAL